MSNDIQLGNGQILGKSITTGEPRLIKTDDGGYLIINIQALSGTILNTPSGVITSTATSTNLSVGTYKELAIDVNITAITGTTPTYQLMVERLGADGIWYNIYNGTSITTIGVVSINVGIGASTNVSFGSTIRLRELLGGATPSITRSVSIIGK